ncbi:CBS domain-containing protein [Paradevosia shaoguanensis]|uniref:CBS domain-containing protein n=1 Tax=Paradevosia shaoguanensis TaxID=1335043 RepID=UPI0019334C24|nr:CBS domain-containing protein [Paradevosia shaoguanensis]
MLVDDILQSKGTVVHTIPAYARLSEAVDILNANNIGAVVVTDRSRAVIGILSERDIVRQLGVHGADALDLEIGDSMSSAVITCTRSTSVAMLAERMTEYRIRHIPVIENGDLLGIVSIGDVVKRKIEETEQEADAMREYIASV